MDAAVEPPTVVAEASVGMAAGAQPSSSQHNEGFSEWTAPLVAAGVDFAVVGPLRLGGNARYQYVRFNGSYANEPRAHLAQLTCYASLNWCRSCLFEHGPRLGVGGFAATIASQGARSDQGPYGGFVVTLEYLLGLHVSRGSTIVGGIGLSRADQTGFTFGSPAFQIFLTAGVRFDL
jgi:hypothetical protein